MVSGKVVSGLGGVDRCLRHQHFPSCHDFLRFLPHYEEPTHNNRVTCWATGPLGASGGQDLYKQTKAFNSHTLDA